MANKYKYTIKNIIEHIIVTIKVLLVSLKENPYFNTYIMLIIKLPFIFLFLSKLKQNKILANSNTPIITNIIKYFTILLSDICS